MDAGVVLAGLAAAVVAAGVVWLVSARVSAKKAAQQERAEAQILTRLGTLHVDSEEAFREKLTARARYKRLAAQNELAALVIEGQKLLARLDHWKEDSELTWRADFDDFAQRLRNSSRWRLTPGTAHHVGLQCDDVRRQPWPAFVAISEPVQGRAAIRRGQLSDATETLLAALMAGIKAMGQAPLPAEPAASEGQKLDQLVDEAKEILEHIARNVDLCDDELWKIVHGWRDKVTDTLTDLGSEEAAEYVTSAPPAKSIPYVHITEAPPAAMHTMRQLAGWLDRLKVWRYDRVTGADEA